MAASPPPPANPQQLFVFTGVDVIRRVTCEFRKSNGQSAACPLDGRYKHDDQKLCKRHHFLASCKDPCAICWDTMTHCSSIQLHCLHVFHTSCMGRWSRQAETCPTCRAPLRPEDIVRIERARCNSWLEVFSVLPRQRRSYIWDLVENLTLDPALQCEFVVDDEYEGEYANASEDDEDDDDDP